MSAVVSRPQAAQYHCLFERILPKIQRFANFVFRKEPRSVREDLIAEVIARSYFSFARLVERDKLDVVYPTPLASFACKEVRAGRRFADRPDRHDLLSRRAKRRGPLVQALLERDERGQWQELVVEDRKCGPSEVAMTRVDFRAWLATLNVRNRKIAEALAAGSTTTDVAERFGVSLGRISQLRRELHSLWSEFQGEVVADAA